MAMAGKAAAFPDGNVVVDGHCAVDAAQTVVVGALIINDNEVFS
jgi:hypothetical protein